MIGIDKQAEDGALGGLHAFAGGHAPAGIHDEEDQVAGAAHPHFALQVTLAQLQRQIVLRFSVALALVRSSGAQGGVEGNVLGAITSRPRLDVAATLAFGARVGALASAFARHFVQGRIEPLGLEGVADLDGFAGAFVVTGR